MKRVSLLVFCLVLSLIVIAPVSYEKVFAQQTEYTVVGGDTLTKIAQKYGVSVSELMRANGLSSDIIYIGQKLIIPGKAEVPVSAEPVKPAKKEPPMKMEEEPRTTTPETADEKPAPTEKQDTAPEEPPVVTEEEPPAPGDIDFKWAFVARLDPSGRNKVVNIAELTLNPGSEKPSVTTDDKISLYVEPGENTYVYMYLVDSRGNLELLFPTSMDEATLKSEFVTGRGTYVPAKYEWFTFDENKGTETFYLIASPKRMDELEQMTRDYVNAEGDKEVAKQLVLDKIKGLKILAFSNPVERPLSFGGRIRGLEIDIAKLAVEVKAKKLYSKTIRLKHE